MYWVFHRFVRKHHGQQSRAGMSVGKGDMDKIKVLIVDDSAVIRKVLGDRLALDPLIEVIGTAENGKIALDKVAQLKPDVVTLDIEMPEMNGLEAVKHIREKHPKLPVIMCSSLTAEGASHTLDALANGASDYVTKPSSHGANTRDVVGDELVRKIKGLAQTEHINTPSSIVASPSLANAPAVSLASTEAIAIGVSTGGPNALAELLPLLPHDLSVPVFIVQHMPPIFTKLLAERLNAQSKLTILEAQHEQEVRKGTIYLAPGGFHMEVKRRFGRTFISLNEEAPENSCRPAVDVLFRSVAEVYGAKVLGVMLTGMGQDGLKGCEALKQHGATIIAQNRETSAVWGMPGAVVEAGLAKATLSIPHIAHYIRGSAGGSLAPENSAQRI